MERVLGNRTAVTNTPERDPHALLRVRWRAARPHGNGHKPNDGPGSPDVGDGRKTFPQAVRTRPCSALHVAHDVREAADVSGRGSPFGSTAADRGRSRA